MCISSYHKSPLYQVAIVSWIGCDNNSLLKLHRIKHTSRSYGSNGTNHCSWAIISFPYFNKDRRYGCANITVASWRSLATPCVTIFVLLLLSMITLITVRRLHTLYEMYLTADLLRNSHPTYPGAVDFGTLWNIKVFGPSPIRLPSLLSSSYFGSFVTCPLDFMVGSPCFSLEVLARLAHLKQWMLFWVDWVAASSFWAHDVDGMSSYLVLKVSILELYPLPIDT